MKRYAEYKESGVEWLGEIPKHWEIKRLKHISQKITDGEHISPNFTDEGIPFLSAKDIRERTINFDTTKFVSLKHAQKFWNRCKPSNGDILIVSRGATIGRVGLVECKTDFCLLGSVILIRLNSRNLPFFLYFALNNSKIQECFLLASQSSAQQAIYIINISETVLPIPTLAEQTQISNYLDQKTSQIDSLIANKKKMIDLLKEERAAIINHAVTKGINPDAEMKVSGVEWLGEVPKHWEVKKLKFVAGLRSGNSITSENIKTEGTYPVYGGNGLRGYTSAFTHEGRYALIGRQGALCGNINYAEGKFWASEHAVVATLLGKANVFWFGELLRAMNLGQYSISAAQPGLAVERIETLHIPYPPESEQIAIATHLDKKTSQIDTSINHIEKEISLIEEYRTALINETVTGKIDIRENV